MHCPRCEIPNPGHRVCSDCGMILDYLRARLFSAVRHFETGQPVGRDLAIIELLGVGITGITYKVQDTESGDILVLKFITHDTLYTEQAVRTFRKRLKRLASAPHPSIANPRAVRETEFGYLGLISEIIPGETLARRLAMNEEFELPRALQICRSVADAVGHAHVHGVLHRNLRPTNVIVTPGQEVKVIEFGMPAVRFPTRNHPASNYAAPETFHDPRESDQRSDIYSFGCLLYHLATGREPSRIDLGGTPECIRGVIEKATQGDPAHRYVQFADLLQDLDAALEAVGVKVRGTRVAARVYAPDGEPEPLYTLPGDGTIGGEVESRGEVEEEPVEEPLEEPIEEEVEPVQEEETVTAAAEVHEPDVRTEDEEGGGRGVVVLQGHGGYVHSVDVSPDGRWIASGASDGTVRVWDPACGDCKDTMTGHRGYVYAVGFSADPRYLFSVGMDGQLRKWDVERGQAAGNRPAHADRVFALRVDGEHGRIFTAGMDGRIRIWDAGDMSEQGEIATGGDRIYSVSPSPDGKLVASGSTDKDVFVWSLETKKAVMRLRGHKDRVYAVVFAPDGKWLVSSSLDKTIRIWNLKTGKAEKKLEGHEGHVYTLALSREARYLGSGSMDKTARIWSFPEGELLATCQRHEGTVSAVAFTPTSRYLVTGSYDSSVRIWDLRKLLQAEGG